MLRTPAGRLRVIGVCEAASFLLLLGVAMPLKYFADEPRPVQVIGAAHGGLFLLYLLAVAAAAWAGRWSWVRVLAAAAASVFPAGPFLYDAWAARTYPPAAEA